MKAPRRITAAFLEKIDACEPAVKSFRKAFPNGVTVAKKAVEAFIKRAERDWACGRAAWLDWLMYQVGGIQAAIRLERSIRIGDSGSPWRAEFAEAFVEEWRKLV